MLVTYDIGNDRRRELVSSQLSGCGSRVQLSIFECDLKDEQELAALTSTLGDIIDELDDQIRIYLISATGHGEEHPPTTILGRRTLEERRDFWIL